MVGIAFALDDAASLLVMDERSHVTIEALARSRQKKRRNRVKVIIFT